MIKEEIEQMYRKIFPWEKSLNADKSDIVFDEVVQKGRFIIAIKKEEELEVQRMSGPEKQNSMTYFVIDMSPDAEYTSYRMKFFAQKKAEGRSNGSTRVSVDAGLKDAENEKVKYKPLSSFYLNRYIDTTDKAQMVAVITQGYEGVYSFGEQYNEKLQQRLKEINRTPKSFLNKLYFDDVVESLAHHDKIVERKQEEIEKYKKQQLQCAQKFFLSFIGDKSDFKAEKERRVRVEKIKKFRKKIEARQNKSVTKAKTRASYGR